MRVYVALLEKIESLRGGCFEEYEKLAENQETWITLGHFDAMHTYELPLRDRDLFQAIHESNKTIFTLQRDGRYFYPLYLISSEDAVPFWEGKQPFLAISKIHFADSVDTNKAYDTLLENLRGHAEKHRCTYCAFHTIELSDMILAVTADKLGDLLDFTMTLRMYPDVGKVYTYVGINYGAVKEPSWKPGPEDKIDLLSMRFSVTDFSPAADVLAYITTALGKASVYSVSGVDDIVANWTELETERLVELYRAYFLNKQADTIPWGRCFADVTSRVGIPLENVRADGDISCEEKKNYSKNRATLRANCEKLLRRCDEIRDLIHKRDLTYNWMDPLSSLTSTLVRISRTVMLDEFVYIMFAGVDAFLKNVYNSLQGPNEGNISQYQDFVENWAHLMEHIMRIEGQLTHNPEMRPILYDIPVAMLEYTLSFLKKVSEVLQANDFPKKAEICFLLVPRLCERIEAEELFPAIPDELPGLVLVTIPLQSLYDARTVQRELCHEVSHFVGETCRNRAERKKTYIQAAAALMARVCFGTLHPALLEAIQDSLMRQNMDNPDRPSIVEMQKAVQLWADCLSKEEEEYYALIWNALQKSKAHEPLKLDLTDTLINGTKAGMFCNLLVDLSILFREIYADICMLYLLPISEQEYVESLIQELATEKRVEDRRYEQFAIRIYTGLTAIGRHIPWKYVQRGDGKLYKELNSISTHLNADEEELTDRLIPMTSIYHLLRYASLCYKGLCQLPPKELETVQKMFDGSVSSQLNYEQFLEYINQYRIKLLEN